MISVARLGAVAEIRLQRSDAANAMDNPQCEALASALRRLDGDDSVRAIILAADGPVFCAGTDLKKLATEWPQARTGPVMTLLTQLMRMTKPVLAAVQGAAVGLGATMLLHCDWVVMQPDAWIRLPFLQLGIAPEGAATRLLPARIGRLRTMEVLLTGRPIGADEALQLGLSTSVDADAAERCREIAAELVKRDPGAIRATKALMRIPDDEQLLWSEIEAINELIAKRLAAPTDQ
jgi:enoyl-CoA hydratase/carnithine racemase